VREWDKWTRDRPAMEVKKVKDLQGNGVKIVSYHQCQRKEYVDAIVAAGFRMIVMDESAYITNWDTVTTKNVILTIATKIPRAIMITATPYKKSALELHPMLSLMEPGKWGTAGDFAKLYCHQVADAYDPRGWSWGGVRADNVEVLATALRRIGIRHTRDEVENQLPKANEYEVHLNNPEPDVKKYDEEGILIQERTAMQAWQKAGKDKVDLVMDWIEDAGVAPTIVYTWFKETADIYVDKLQKLHYRVGLITGDYDADENQAVVDKFQAGELDYIVGSIAAMSDGHNIDRCRRIIFAEGTWTNSIMNQAKARAIRMTTLHAVDVVYFWLSDSIDKAIRSLLNKREIETGLLGL
jgi:SNF2 family DNA or RNA helicase